MPLDRRSFIAGAAAVACAPLVAPLTPTVPRAVGRSVSTRDSVGTLTAPDETGRFQRFEIVGDGLPPASNPFDPAEIDVRAHFRDPAGRQLEIPAFWYQGYRRTSDGTEQLLPEGEATWKARFAFDADGTWTWWWTVRTVDGETTGDERSVTVAPSGSPGFVRRTARDHRYLVHDNGDPYFAIGENVCWSGETIRWPSTLDYDRWFTALGEQQVNFARLWMATWGFAIEWDDTGLGDYTQRLDRAWGLDHAVDLAAANGIVLMLCLNNHGPFSTEANSEWAENPYNAANGGPLALSTDVITDRTAIDLFKRRYRYIVARWGYSTNVLAWELWNEINLIGHDNDALIAQWHREMAGYLRSIDPFGHMITTSGSPQPADTTITEAELDVVQLHYYATGDTPPDDPDVASAVSAIANLETTRLGRPFLAAEVGVSWQGADETRMLDPEGIGFHDLLWAPALSGACGTGISWWWDSYIDVEPERFYPQFGAIARFLDGVRWDSEQFTATAATVWSPSKTLTVFGLDGAGEVLLWIKNDEHVIGHPDSTQIADGELTVPIGPLTWAGQWWDTMLGTPLGPVDLQPDAGGQLMATIPPFVGDIAARLTAT